MPLQEELNIIFGNRSECTKENKWNEEMFESRIVFDSLNTKDVINTIFDYIKEKYDKEKEYEVKLNI